MCINRPVALLVGRDNLDSSSSEGSLRPYSIIYIVEAIHKPSITTLVTSLFGCCVYE